MITFVMVFLLYDLKTNRSRQLSAQWFCRERVCWEAIRSIKEKCLNRMLIFGEHHLEYVIKEYMEYYHTERPHQGLDNEIIEPPPQGTGEIVGRERLGGLLKPYRRVV